MIPKSKSRQVFFENLHTSQFEGAKYQSDIGILRFHI